MAIFVSWVVLSLLGVAASVDPERNRTKRKTPRNRTQRSIHFRSGPGGSLGGVDSVALAQTVDQNIKRIMSPFKWPYQFESSDKRVSLVRVVQSDSFLENMGNITHDLHAPTRYSWTFTAEGASVERHDNVDGKTEVMKYGENAVANHGDNTKQSFTAVLVEYGKVPAAADSEPLWFFNKYQVQLRKLETGQYDKEYQGSTKKEFFFEFNALKERYWIGLYKRREEPLNYDDKAGFVGDEWNEVEANINIERLDDLRHSVKMDFGYKVQNEAQGLKPLLTCQITSYGTNILMKIGPDQARGKRTVYWRYIQHIQHGEDDSTIDNFQVESAIFDVAHSTTYEDFYIFTRTPTLKEGLLEVWVEKKPDDGAMQKTSQIMRKPGGDTPRTPTRQSIASSITGSLKTKAKTGSPDNRKRART